MRSLLDDGSERLQFAGHETFPCRYGWLKKGYDAVTASPATNVFLPEIAIVDFGVGKNMALSMKHWSLAFGVLDVVGGDRSKSVAFSPTSIGREIFGGGDPYLENIGSIWTLHWRLVSTPGRATTWYYAFNEFAEPFVTKEILVARLSDRLDELRSSGRMSTGRVTSATLSRDAECFIRTYLPRPSNRTEDGLECPFTELGLLASMPGGGAAQFRRGPKPTLPDEVFAFALIDFWQNRYGRRGTLSVETVAQEPGSPGRAFLLDEDSVAERLERIAEVTGGALTWDEGAGIRQVAARSLIGTMSGEALLHPLYRRGSVQ